MATAADAELVLKLYELRRDERMRAARHWVIHEFNPRTLEDLLTVQRDFGSEHNQFWRQVIGYWEMASALVVYGALDRDLFLNTNGENIYLVAKFGRLQQEYAQRVSGGFMPHTTALVANDPAASARSSQIREYLESQG